MRVGRHRDIDRRRCSSAAAAAGDTNCDVDAHRVQIGEALVVAPDAVGAMSASCLALSALVSAVAKSASGIVDAVEVRLDELGRRPRIATWACAVDGDRLFGRCSRPGLPCLRAAVFAYLFHWLIAAFRDIRADACPVRRCSGVPAGRCRFENAEMLAQIGPAVADLPRPGWRPRRRRC